MSLDPSNLFASELILTGRSALAEWAVEDQCAVQPDLPDRYGPRALSDWRADTQVRLNYLGEAVAAGRPRLFAAYVAWSKVAFCSRGVPVRDLRVNLECLRGVLTEKLPGSAASRVSAYVDEALSALDSAPDELPSCLPERGPMRELAARYLEAALEGRRGDAARLLTAAVDAGTPVATIYAEVLEPAQAEVGRLWHMNELTIAEEHACTAATQMAMAQLHARLPAAPSRGRRLLAAAVGGDMHEVGLRMVADHFEMDGWAVVYLGANTPAPALADAVRDYRPDAVGLSATLGCQVRTVADVVSELRGSGLCDRVPIIVGGPLFRLVDDLWRVVGADGSATSAGEAVRVANRLVDARGASA